MDDRRFDSLTKALAAGKSRRSVLKGILGLGGAALAGGVLLDGDTDAATRPTPTPKPVKCPGNQVSVGGVCTCPPSAPSKCGPACCNPAGIGAAHTECCDNACCHGQCYGEELCCPTGRIVCNGRCLEVGQCCNDSDCGDPCQICNPNSHVCQPRCDEETQVCCTEQAGPGVCVQGSCCPGVPSCGEGMICCAIEGTTTCVEGSCCDNSDCPPSTACNTSWCQDHACNQISVSCDDENACTIDTCDPVLGCIHTAVNCDDGNACTRDSCDSERGCVYTAVNCDDGDICTIDFCDPDLGCVHTIVNCDDGNLCTTEYCDSNLGCVYEAVDCDDGDPCTNDSCDPRVGCIHTPVDCSRLDNPETCVIGVCSNGTCTTQSTCGAGSVCLEDGSCGAPGTCAGEAAFCQHNVDCCAGCCIANLPNFDDWLKVCTDAGLIGNAAVLCAQAITEGNYALTCRNPPVITFNAFPANPVPLPCAQS